MTDAAGQTGLRVAVVGATGNVGTSVLRARAHEVRTSVTATDT